MHRIVRVVVESDLIQLDREFDFLVPERLQNEVEFGQRVSVLLGRSKKLHTGFIVDLPDGSEFAATEIVGLVDTAPVLTREIYQFARSVADRQCVAIGEILSLAIPDHMPRIERSMIQRPANPGVGFPDVRIEPPLGDRAAVLASSRTLYFQDRLVPDWALIALRRASEALNSNQSTLIIAPEQSKLQVLERLASDFGLSPFITLAGSQKKSDRFKSFHEVLSVEYGVVAGTRNAIYAPISNLTQVILIDDLDESLREPGSPFTHARELALMRAQGKSLLAIAGYRSLEVQRLVEIGYLSDHSVISQPPRISFVDSSQRLDSAAFKLLREQLELGPVLALTPRKGFSAAAYCTGCGQKLSCESCHSMIWEPSSGLFTCRNCNTRHVSCSNCRSIGAKSGRTGSSRTVEQFGKAFPNVLISEITAEKKVSRIRDRNHLVVATPGSAPRLDRGYSAVVILDTDVWLNSSSIRAEQIAIRDWQEAFELLMPEGRALIASIPKELGQAVSLQQHRQLASQSLKDITKLGLPPAVRVTSLEGSSEVIQEALNKTRDLGVVEVSTKLGESARTVIRYPYKLGGEVARELRELALKTNSRLVGTNRRRGLKIVMEDVAQL